MTDKIENPEQLLRAQDIWPHKLTQTNNEFSQKASAHKSGVNVAAEETEAYNASAFSHQFKKDWATRVLCIT